MDARKGRLFVVLTIFATSAHAQYAPPRVYMVHGLGKTCPVIGELDRALDRQDARYFAGWTPADYNAAIQWSATCVGFGSLGPSRMARLRAYQASAMQGMSQPEPQPPKSLESQWSQTAEAARQTEVNRKRDTAKATFKEKDEILDKCKATHRGLLYASAQTLLADIEVKKSAQEAIARERKVGAISGMVNKAVLHSAGESIVEMEEDIKEQWPVYKKLGGTAASPQAIPRNLPNPCAEEESEVESARPMLPNG